MSNRRSTPNLSKTNRCRLTNHARTIVAALLLSRGVLSPGMIAWANGPAPGTVIENQATGSFVDPSDSSTKLIESNVVQVTVAEVAGLTVTNNGFTEPNDGAVDESDTVYFDFVLTNVGNDPTQFVIPGSASVTNGTQAGNIQIIEYDADGTGTGAAEDLSGSNITVPGGGDNTGNLLNGVANTNNGSVPAGGSITVRVPVTAGTAGLDLTVTLGDTVATNGQNEVYIAGSNDVYTQDNTGTTNGDTDGAPISNEREASDSLTVAIATSSSPPTPPPGAPQCLLPQNLVTDGSFDNGLTFFPATGNWGTRNRAPAVINPGNEPTGTIANGYPALGSIIAYNENDSADDALLVTPLFDVDQTYLNGQLDIWFDTYWRHAGGGGSKDSTLELRVNGTPYWQMRTINGEGGGSSTLTPLNGATMSSGSPTGLSNPGGGGAYSQWGNVRITIPYTSNTTPQIEFAMKGQGLASDDFGVDRIYTPVCLPDRGDAPDSYGTDVTAGNSGGDPIGPFHRIVNDLSLGTNPDGEINAESPLDGTGDGADEDGVTLSDIDPNATTYSVPASDIAVTNNSGLGAATLHAWIDFDGSGTFETDEYTSQTVTSGTTGGTPNGPLTWSGPGVSGLTDGTTTYARFRLTTDGSINAATPGGEAHDGEVEDYQVAIAAPIFNISGTLYVDSNSNDLYEDSAGGGSEAPMPENITVRLLSSDGSTELATTVTDTNGLYSFPDLSQGTYQVAVETTDPDIPIGHNIGTPTPLTISLTSADAIAQDFGFDLITTGSEVAFCQSPNGEVYSGGISNDIYAIYPSTGATFRVTTTALAGVVNSLATDHFYRVAYYAEGQAIYAWDPINDTHVRLQDSSGNLNVSAMPGGGSISSLTSGGAAFYNGSYYLGIERAQGNSNTEVYRVDFVPGSNGLVIQSLTALGVNDNTGGANGGLNSADWGDMIISDAGVIYGATRRAGFTWSFDLSTGIYNQISGNYLGQLAKDGDGVLWGLSDTSRIQQVDINTGSLFGPSSPTSSPIADMAECVVGLSTIGDRIWDDLDGDGVQDPLEPGIANVTVGIYRDLNGNGVIDTTGAINFQDPLLTTQVTNSSGNYDFVDLIRGNYIIKVLEGTADDLDGTNVLDGAVLTTTTTTPGGQQTVTIPLGINDYDDADFGYQLPVIPQNPNVLLVKRITQINNDTVSAGGDDLSGYINQDDVTNPYDDNDITVADPVDPTDPPKDTDQWPDPNTNLIGGIDGGNVMPNDEIEYTIYYLSSGDATAESVLFCDYVPTFTSYIPNGYNGSAPQATGGIGGADLSIELFRNGSTDYHTGANDGDSATYFAPGADPATSFPGIDCDGDGDGINANANGAVVVNLGDLPDATTDAAGAYGYVRFRTRVK
ncbi:MAG: SdrD B-like domain-containing protein [Cyanobacteria bacterium P01_H01_bin.21]